MTQVDELQKLMAMNDAWLVKRAEWPDIDPEDAYFAAWEARDREVEFLRGQNALLHEQLNGIRAKVHDGSLSAKQIVTSLRTWLDRPK